MTGRPNLTHDEAVTVLSERFSIKSQAANMKSFPSYDDQNIYVKAEDGEEYVLKVYNSLLNGNNTEILECQNQLRSFISKDNISTPKPISATDDAKSQSIVIEIERDGTMNEWFALLLTFIPGKVMGTIRSPSHSLLANVGSYLGRMDKALLGFSHPAAVRSHDWDLRNAKPFILQYKKELDEGKQKIIDQFLAYYSEKVLPITHGLQTDSDDHDNDNGNGNDNGNNNGNDNNNNNGNGNDGVHSNGNDCTLSANDNNNNDDGSDASESKETKEGTSKRPLRQCVIQGDANAENIIVNQEGTEVAAVIDFGDVVQTDLINSLGICLGYLMLEQEDPVGAAKAMIQAYDKELKLTEEEIEIVFMLGCVRICVSVTLSNHAYSLEPDNEYLLITAKPGWAFLHLLMDKYGSPAKAQEAFMRAYKQ